MEYQKNEDGTDKLDEQGNPIPVEITDKEKESAEEKTQLVEEIKELRLKNGLMKDLLEGKKEEPQAPKEPVTDEEKIAAQVRAILQQEKASNAQANKKAAFEKFVAENKEFHPENDALGLKRGALEKKIAQFNTEGLSTMEEFYTVIGDAKTLLMGNDNSPDTSRDKTPYSNTPTPRGTPPAKREEELSPKEIKLAQTTGRTKEQILALKRKHPEMLQQLLDYVRD